MYKSLFGELIGVLVFVACAVSLRGQNETTAVLSIQESIKAGDLETASRLLDESLAGRPQDGGLLNLRGILHAQRREMAQAQNDFRKAVRLSPELTPAWQNLGRTCQQLGEFECAVGAWQSVLKAKPGDEEAHESLGLLYESQGKFTESLRELNAGKSNNLLLRCLDLSGLTQIKEAKAVAVRLAQLPDFTESDLESMLQVLDSPSSAAVIAVLVEGLDKRRVAGLPSLQRLVVAYEQLQRPKDALRTLERVAKLDPNNTTHLLELARLAESNKDYKGALGYLAHARDLDPSNARIHFLFGLVAGELNLPVEAKRSFEKALEIDPENPDYNYAMGTVFLSTRDASTANLYLRKFVRARPKDARGHYALGLAHFALADYDEAKQEMQITEDDPSLAAAAEYYLGRIARLEGNIDEATRRLTRSVGLMPSFSETHTELARIALLQGRTEAARTELERALLLAPESFQANEQLLVLYTRTHDPRAGKQKELLKKLDEDRSKRAELMLRGIEVRP